MSLPLTELDTQKSIIYLAVATALIYHWLLGPRSSDRLYPTVLPEKHSSVLGWSRYRYLKEKQEQKVTGLTKMCFFINGVLHSVWLVPSVLVPLKEKAILQMWCSKHHQEGTFKWYRCFLMIHMHSLAQYSLRQIALICDELLLMDLRRVKIPVPPPPPPPWTRQVNVI